MLESDIPVFVDWLERFSDSFDYPAKGPINREVAALFFSRFVDSASQCAFVAEDNHGRPIGTLGFSVLPHPWTGKTVLYKAFWYSAKPGVGLELLRRVGLMCRAGAVEQIVIGSMNERVSALLEREGYKPIETNYILET